MIIIEVILRIAIYYCIVVGGYILIGALCLRCSCFSTDDDTWSKCIKKSWINSRRMKPWDTKIDE